MTIEEKTELKYLLDLVFESSKWKLEDGQDGIRLEVEHRINSILFHEETDNTGSLTDEDFTAIEAAKLNEHLASPKKVDEVRKAWESGRVRCSENGKLVWRPRNQCHQEPMYPGNPLSKKFKWVYDGPRDSE